MLSGPFVNQTLHLGPYNAGPLPSLPENWGDDTGPRCLVRDLNNWGITTFNSQSKIDASLAWPDIGNMTESMEARVGADLGVHAGGHFSLGPDMLDFFSSPLDPAFFLHHGMIDRVWETWQGADPEIRRYQYNGTSTIFNGPETPEVNNDTLLSFGILGETIAVMETVHTIGGRYCYRYE